MIIYLIVQFEGWRHNGPLSNIFLLQKNHISPITIQTRNR